MKIFITGATGFIGNSLAMKLASSGHIVHALCRSVEKSKLLNHPNIKIFMGDILDTVSIEKAMTGCSAGYHLAAYVKIWAEDPLLSERINVTGTKNVLNACIKFKIKKVVITSTAGVLGPSLNGELTNEDSIREIEFFTEYERTKFKSTTYVKEYCQKGLDIVVVYPTRVFGPGLLTESNSVTLLIHRFVKRRVNYIPGSSKLTGNYAYIKDVVEGHILAMQAGKTGRHYILGGENLSFKQIYNILYKLKSKKNILVSIPIGILLFASEICLILYKFFNTKPLVTREWVKKISYHWKCSVLKAETELGYKITPSEVAIKETIDWLGEISDQNE